MKKIILLVSLFLIPFIGVNALEKSIDDFSYGINGKPILKTINVVMKDKESESNILSTSTGIYVLRNNNYTHIDVNGSLIGLNVIDDINSDSVKDIVYAVNSANEFYNLIAVDGNNGNIIWKTRVTSSIFNQSAGFIDTNKNIYDLKIIDKYIYLIYDYTLEKIDYKTGKSIFKYEDKDNIWSVTGIKDINSDKSKDIVIGNQLGEVKALNGSNGKVIWNSKVVNRFLSKNKIEIKRNVWQVLFYNDTLYATGEDGKLYKINYKNGKVLNSIVLYELDDSMFNDYYNVGSYKNGNFVPSGKNSNYFKAFEMYIIDDNKMSITCFINSGNGGQYRTMKGINPTVKIIDLKKFKEQSSILLKELTLKNVEVLNYNGNLILPIALKDNKLVVNEYSISTGDKINSHEISIDGVIISDLSKVFLSSTSDNLLIEGYNTFSIVLDKNYKVIKNNDNYFDSYVIENNKNEITIGYKINNVTRRIVKYNVINNEIIWEYNVTNNFSNNGIDSINIVSDFSSDNINDLTALVNKVDSTGNITESYILILDMKTGKEISFKSIFLYSYVNESNKKINVYLTGNNIYPIKDINKDSKSELVIDSNIVSGNKIAVIGAIDNSIGSNGTNLDVGDINSDSISDIVFVTEKVATIYLSKISNNNISYVSTNNKYSYDKELLNMEQSIVVPDINNDGIKEVLFNAVDKDGKQYYKALSGKDLKEVISLKPNTAMMEAVSYTFLKFDVNEDGYNDLYENNYWGGTYNIISGKTGEILISIVLNNDSSYYEDGKFDTGEKTIYPFPQAEDERIFVMGNDVNNDKHKELLFLKEEYYPDTSIMLNAYDVYNKNTSPIKSTTILKRSSNNNIMVSNDSVEYSKYIIKINDTDNLYILSSYLNTPMIYDINNNSIISGFDISISNAFKINDEKLLMINSLNKPYVIDYNNYLELKKVTSNKSPLGLNWTFKKDIGMNMVKIYDNGIYVKTVYDNNTNIILSNGKHELAFEATDVYGKTMNNKVNVTIEKNNNILIIFVILSTLIVFSLSLFPHFPRIKRNIAVRRVGR